MPDDAVRLIPFGKVTTYGHIAKLVGMPRHSRHVGQALKYLDPGSDIPWQRVIGSSGKISSRGPGTDGHRRQGERLEAEDVVVRTAPSGDLTVSLAEYGWFPESVELGDDAGE